MKEQLDASYRDGEYAIEVVFEVELERWVGSRTEDEYPRRERQSMSTKYIGRLTEAPHQLCVNKSPQPLLRAGLICAHVGLSEE